ncbi:MAG: hypothetical protein NC301_01105 [Bacteroides sp.]|nr:hypothetical protein [Bacteroides sp.]MCM1378789.1 hypothetical protein [Bacteroides sp.]MCM1445406.1 hypothetical protein [Prevotella sp.]
MIITGKPYKVNMSRDALYQRMSDLSDIRGRVASLPDDLKAKLGTVNFPDDETLAFSAPGVGEMKFRIVERMPYEAVRFMCDTGMMPIHVIINLAEADEAHTNVSATIEAEIPAMLRPLIGGKLQEAADKFGEMFGQLNA